MRWQVSMIGRSSEKVMGELVKYEDECVGCASPGYPCQGENCPNRKVPHYYCDICGHEIDGIPIFDYGYELCNICYKIINNEN